MRCTSTVCLVLALLTAGSGRADALEPVADFGANPGALLMYEHAPAALPAGRPLVVVLHGCTQTAAAMETAGWSALADELGFAVEYAEQTTANNPARCFNWAGEYGDPTNLIRGRGENQSILSMIDHALAAHAGDPARVYITGFSAGGAFAAVMLATWPDRIAAGAILAGVPYRCATDLPGALNCQALDQHPELQRTPAAWATLVTAAADGHAGPWPRVAIWHGTADATVDPVAGDALVAQWTAVHGLTAAPITATVGELSVARYGTTIERWTVPGMGHAVPLGAGDPDGGCAGVGAYFEDRGVCSTRRIAAFFGLLDDGDGDGGDGGGNGDGGGSGDGAADRDHPTCGGCSAAAAPRGPLALILLGALTLHRRRRTRPARRG